MAVTLTKVILMATVDLTKNPVEVLESAVASNVSDGNLSGGTNEVVVFTGADLVALNTCIVKAHNSAKAKWGIS